VSALILWLVLFVAAAKMPLGKATLVAGTQQTLGSFTRKSDFALSLQVYLRKKIISILLNVSA
jgi:hypothetical protein